MRVKEDEKGEGEFKLQPPGHIEARENYAEGLEKAYLTHYLKLECGQINKVADLMGISTRTVARQMEKFGLNKVSFKEKRAED